MIKIHSLGSSSYGNCFVISDGISLILLDTGLRSDVTKAKLFELGISLRDITGILVTHGHQDHIQGINAVRGCKKYMTKGTFDFAGRSGYTIDEKEVQLINIDKQFEVGTFRIKAFKTKHDMKDSCGFAIKNASDEKILYLTDTGIANINYKDAEVYIIEANHNEEEFKQALEDGLVKENQYKRTSTYHLSQEKALDYLQRNIGSKTKHIILMHISTSEKNPIRIMNRFRKELNTEIVSFVHPHNHKLSNVWECGYTSTRTLEL